MDQPTRPLGPPGTPRDPRQPTKHLDPPPQEPDHTCGKCGGELIQMQPKANATMIGGRRLPLELEVANARRDTHTGLRRAVPCYTWVCLDCGYTEFYTQEPRKMLEAE